MSGRDAAQGSALHGLADSDLVNAAIDQIAVNHHLHRLRCHGAVSVHRDAFLGCTCDVGQAVLGGTRQVLTTPLVAKLC
jgi:hypothetical protein